MEFIIIEDDQRFIEEFNDFFSKTIFEDQLTMIQSDYIHSLKKYADVVFVDIDLGSYDGILIAKQIKSKYPKSMIVFLSNREELVYESFDAQPVYFLRKSRYKEDFHKVLKIIEEKKKRTCIIEQDEYNLDSILYLEYTNRITTVVCVDGCYMYRKSLHTIMEQLDHDYFAYIQRSIIINLVNIKKMDQDEIELVDSSVFTVSRKYKAKLRKVYKRFLLC